MPSCGVCVNPRTRRACGKPAVGEVAHPIFDATPVCDHHAQDFEQVTMFAPPSGEWWLRMRFVEGGWEIAGQTQTESVVRGWDDDIDRREGLTGIDHEWIISIPYDARPVPTVA